MAHRLKAVVHGNVQGVGFRYWAHHTGEKLGVHGWVRNEPNGTVAVEAESTDKDVLHALFVELHKGPDRRAGHASRSELGRVGSPASPRFPGGVE